MPEVSVVLPVYNAASTIDRSVRSILQQSLRDLELIVVNDGSTDETLQILQRCADSRLKIITLEHQGVASAANFGTQQAQCEVIARMDADDVARPDRLHRQHEMLQTSDYDVVGSQVRILTAHGKPLESMQRYERWVNEETATAEQILALRFVEFPIVNPTILARRRYFELSFRNDDFPEDYDLMLRAAASGLRFGKVPAVLLDWYDSDHRLTRTGARYSAAAFMSCRRQRLLEGPLANVAIVDLWGVGRTGKPWLRWLQQQGLEVRNVYDVNPRKIGVRIHNVEVVDPEKMRPADGTPLIIAVGADGTRPLIQAHIREFGHICGHDAWFVA